MPRTDTIALFKLHRREVTRFPSINTFSPSMSGSIFVREDENTIAITLSRRGDATLPLTRSIFGVIGSVASALRQITEVWRTIVSSWQR